MILTVHIAKKDDLFQDVVRIHRSHRKDIRTGSLCQVNANGRSIIAIARNSLGDKNDIGLDSSQRIGLGVRPGEEVDFNIVRVPWYGQLLWVWRASDPVNRTAGRLGILSMVLGIIGLALGTLSVWLAIKPPG